MSLQRAISPHVHVDYDLCSLHLDMRRYMLTNLHIEFQTALGDVYDPGLSLLSCEADPRIGTGGGASELRTRINQHLVWHNCQQT